MKTHVLILTFKKVTYRIYRNCYKKKIFIFGLKQIISFVGTTATVFAFFFQSLARVNYLSVFQNEGFQDVLHTVKEMPKINLVFCFI